MSRSSAARKINYETDVPQLTDFGVSPDGLPIFNGTTFDSHVSGWNDIEGPKSQLQWAQAAIAASLASKHGEGIIEKFAYEIKKSGSYVRGLARTYRAFQNSGRMAYLSFWHHYVAATSNNPLRSIRVANDREMSTRELERYVKLQAALPTGRVAKKLALVKPPKQDGDPQSAVAEVEEPDDMVDDERARENDEMLLADIVKVQLALQQVKDTLQSTYLSNFVNGWSEEMDWELEQATKTKGQQTERLFALIQSGCYTKTELCKRGRFTMAEVTVGIETLKTERKIVEDKQRKGEIASGITNTLYRPRDLSYQDSYQPTIER